MNGDKPEKPGFKEVIDSVDVASNKELAVLSRIEKGLTEGLPSAGSAINVQPSDDNTSRSVALNKQRKDQQDKKRRKNAAKQSNNKHIATKEQSTSPEGTKPDDTNHKTTIRISDDNQKPDDSQNFTKATQHQPNNNHKTDLKQDSEDALKILRSPNRPEATRDKNGRFTSKDKVNDDKESRSRSRHDKEQEENSRKENALLTRVGKMMSELGDPMEADSTNAAGTAAGGSFWKAGHEVYSMAKGMGSGALDAKNKMKDFLGGEEGDDGTKKPGMLRRTFSRKPKDGSKNVIERQVQKQQVNATEHQTEQIKEGNKEITDRLDELIDKQGGKGNGKGLWGSVGAMFGKVLRKPILAAGKLLTKVISLPFAIAAAVMTTAFKLGKAILLKAMAVAGGSRAADALGDISDASMPDKNGKKDKGRKKKSKPGKPKKGNFLKRLFKSKGAKVAGGIAATAATGYAANEALDLIDGEKGTEASESKKTPPEKKVATEEPAQAKSVEKTASKETSALAKTEEVASKEAGTIAKEGTGKAVEKGALKVAEEGGEKLAVKAGAKVAAKTVGKVALRSIPIIGQIAGAGYDAVDGWTDTEAQQNAFGLKSTDKVSGRQKTEYTAANILDMGGLVSGAAGLLSSGAGALGMDRVAKALDFDTTDIAKLIDKGVGDSISTVKSVTDTIGITGNEKKADERNKTLVDTVKKGASDTIEAINRLVAGGVSAATSVITGKPNNGQVAVGDIKTPVPTKTGKMQLDTMAGTFASLEQQYGLPPGLLRGVATTESGGNNGAYNKKSGAMGMFQFIRKTADEYGLVGNDAFDPDKSAAAAAKKLGGLVKRYNGDVGLALSAYNWGEGNIQKKGMGAAPKETREYAPKVLAAMQAAGAAAPTTAINYTNAKGASNDALPATQSPTAGTPTATPQAQTPTAQQQQQTTQASIDARFTSAKLPTDSQAFKDIPGGGYLSKVINDNGGDKLANAEGERHQVSAAELDALQQRKAPQSQQKVQEAKESAAQAHVAASGSMYSRAQLPTDNSWLKDVPGGELISQKINEWGGDKIANAEGLRHQASAAEIDAMQTGAPPVATTSAKTAKQNVQPATMAIPSKIPAVKDMSASQMKSTVNVANEMTLPKSLTKTWESILKRLDEIAGHTKDTAEKTGDNTPKANTPQPAPRTSVPLTIDDASMSEVARN